MNELDYYVGLLSNTSRLRAFRAGIEATVRPGDVVLDMGTGVGTYAMLAAKAGAGHVYAVEMNRITRVARMLAQVNGVEDRVTFLEGKVPGVDLPREVDVLVFEDFTVGYLDGPMWDLLRHLEEQLPAGVRTVPHAGRLNLAPISAEACWTRGLPPVEGQGESLGLEWGPLREVAANSPHRMFVGEHQLLAPPVSGTVLPILPVPDAGAMRVDGAWTAPRAAVMHGLALWFDLELSPGVWLSNVPRPDPEPWGQLFLTLDPPLDVPARTLVEASVWRDGTREGRPDWIVWEVRVAGEVRRGHEFASELLDLDDLGIHATPE